MDIGPVGTSHNHTDGETPSITVRRTDILLGQQTPRTERRQNSYTAARDKPIQALANQRTQLQLRLQLARTEPSFNGIKGGPQQAKSALTAPLSTRERHISSSVPVRPAERSDRQYHQQLRPRREFITAAAPTCVGSNSTHRRQSTLPA
jgi:hypothetical protein